eukprot:m.30619 g.30619  ORF g.30619 m.30619 type:complete len:256 (+) comp41277_c0_seq1:473-1240(+)
MFTSLVPSVLASRTSPTTPGSRATSPRTPPISSGVDPCPLPSVSSPLLHLLFPLVSRPAPVQRFSCPILLDFFPSVRSNTQFLDFRLMDFSFAYFVMDFVFDSLTTFEWLFFLHHVVCIVMMSLSRFYLDRTGSIYIIIMFLGEVTNVLQLPWGTAKEFGYMKFANFIFLPYFYFFVFVRGAVATWLIHSIATEFYFTDHGHDDIPPLVIHLYMFCLVSVCSASLLFAAKNYKDYRKSVKEAAKDAEKQEKKKQK